jgi:nicotinate-nucleotide adenylyltransferase
MGGGHMYIVFGGSFNPPTIAHKKIIQKLLEAFEDSKVLLLPVGNDYKKEALISFKHRVTMLKLLTKDLPNVMISTIENNRDYQGTLYSLRELEKTYQPLYFVIGSDNLKDFKNWINYQELLKNYPFIVMKRKGGFTKKQAEILFKDIMHQFIFIDFNSNISSTNIRKDVLSSKKRLTDDVYQYIVKNNLYQELKHV